MNAAAVAIGDRNATPPAVPVARLRHLLRWLLRRYQRVRVQGASMSPTLRDGESVLVEPDARLQRSPQVGDIILARHPYLAGVKMIKRVTRIEDDGACFVVGDNESSTDSRAFGALPQSLLLGRVVARFTG